ncbi:F-box/kelch-repeat protein At3g23880-like [Malania oleifera]|uniref:F-box/kelch-repeat protein At3g23880-like n=1 Tax=Malania oleifera TaxID=397392 RepID=UPI0025AE95D9|nr:F-box/kelch-repeat protein At3g23880-like [Malania oleifera]
MGGGDIPEDLIKNVLQRLPVKSLLRFQCVCKSWCAMLKNPSFITDHFHFSSNHNDNKRNVLWISRCYYSRGTCYCISINPPHMMVPVEFPLKGGGISTRIVGHWNGIICAHTSIWNYGGDLNPMSRRYFLWNPTTREYKVLPLPQYLTHDSRCYGPGFGFDSKTNDYKIVKFVNCYSEPCKAEVYSLRSDTWREIQAPPVCFEKYVLKYYDRNIDGAIFWAGISDDPVIVWFDMANETFRLIPLPHDVLSIYRRQDVVHRVTSFKESFALLVFPMSESHSPYHLFDVWVMSELGVAESWVKLHSVALPERSLPLGLSNNGELLIVKGGNGALAWYYPITRKLVNLEFQSSESFYPGKIQSIESVFYTESLVSLGGQNVRNMVSDPYFQDLYHPEKFADEIDM